jgi:hypothetical protein
MQEIREEIMRRMHEIEGIHTIDDHLCFFSNGGPYVLRFKAPNNKEFVDSLRPIIESLVSAFGDSVIKTMPSKLLRHNHRPTYDASKNLRKEAAREVWVTYQVWLRPGGESC